MDYLPEFSVSERTLECRRGAAKGFATLTGSPKQGVLYYGSPEPWNRSGPNYSIADSEQTLQLKKGQEIVIGGRYSATISSSGKRCNKTG